MSPEEIRLLVGLVSVLLGGGLVTALVAYRKQKKSEPIEEETASVINARSAGEMALALAKQQESTILMLQKNQEAMGIELSETRVELQAARTELAAVRTMWSGVVNWIRDLYQNWETYRLLDRPPGGLPPGIL